MTREHSTYIGPYSATCPQNVRHVPNVLLIALLDACESAMENDVYETDVFGWGRAALCREILCTWDLSEFVWEVTDVGPRRERLHSRLVRVVRWRITNMAWRAPDGFPSPTGDPVRMGW